MALMVLTTRIFSYYGILEYRNMIQSQFNHCEDRQVHLHFMNWKMGIGPRLNVLDRYKALGIFAESTERPADIDFEDELSEDNFFSLYRVRVLLFQKKYRDFLECEKIINQHPHPFVRGEMLFMKGLYHVQLGDYSSATHVFRAAAKIFFENQDIFRYALSFLNALECDTNIDFLTSQEVKTIESFIHKEKIYSLIGMLKTSQVVAALKQNKILQAKKLSKIAVTFQQRHFDLREQFCALSLELIITLLENQVPIDMSLLQTLRETSVYEQQQYYLHVIESLMKSEFPELPTFHELFKIPWKAFPLFESKMGLPEKLVNLLATRPHSKEELMAKLWPSDVINSSHEARLKMLVLRTKKKFPNIGFKKGKYQINNDQ